MKLILAIAAGFLLYALWPESTGSIDLKAIDLGAITAALR